MPTRGRHQSTSKECQRAIQRLQSLDAVTAVIIGRSYGGKSLGKDARTGSIKLQRQIPGGWKAITQSAKGLQEIFIKTKPGQEKWVEATVQGWDAE